MNEKNYDYFLFNKAKGIVVFATTNKSMKHKGISAFIVPMDTPGVSLGKFITKYSSTQLIQICYANSLKSGI